MRIPISEARRRLSALVKALQKDPRAKVEITVRDEVVAELRAAGTAPAPGAAARRLLALRRRFAEEGFVAREPDVSSRVKEHLYGSDGVIR